MKFITKKFIIFFLLFGSMNSYAVSLDSRLLDFKYELEQNQLLLRHDVDRIIRIRNNDEKINALKAFIAYTGNRLPSMAISSSSKRLIRQNLNELESSLESPSKVVDEVVNVFEEPKKVEVVPEVEAKIVEVAPVIKTETPTPRPKTPRVHIEIKPTQVETVTKEESNFSFGSFLKYFLYVSLFAFGTLYVTRFVMKRRSMAKRKLEAKNKVSLKSFLDKEYKNLKSLAQPYLITNSKGKIAFINDEAKSLLGLELDSNINSSFDSISHTTSTASELVKDGKTFRAEKTSRLINNNKNEIGIYYFTEVDKKTNPYNINSSTKDIKLKLAIEQALEKKSYLFQIIGMSIHLDINNESNFSNSAKSIVTAIDNTLLATYLILKDSESNNKHVTIKCSQDRTGRNSLTFTIPGQHISVESLKTSRIFPNRIEDSIANIFKRNDLSLSALRCRTLISNYKTQLNANESEIEISFYGEANNHTVALSN